MISKNWDKSSINYLNHQFALSNYGPLYGPIKSFSLKRRDDLMIELTTTSSSSSVRDVARFPEKKAGSVSVDNTTISFDAPHSRAAIAYGVRPYETKTHSNNPTRSQVREQTCLIGKIESVPPDDGQAAYLVEWIDNFDHTTYFWADHFEEELSTNINIQAYNGRSLIKNSSQSKRFSGGIDLEIDGQKLFIIPSEEKSHGGPNGQASVVYEGCPNDGLREKIRNCISLALGVPIVSLGYTLLNEQHEHLGFQCVSPYTIDSAIFKIFAMPFAPLGGRSARLVDKKVIQELVDAFSENYEKYNLRHICWLYWHAKCSPIHARAVQLGAAVESLIKSHNSVVPNAYLTGILEKRLARQICNALSEQLNKFDIPQPAKEELLKKLSNLNHASQRTTNNRFFEHLGLSLSEKERTAWQRRNDAAHGNMTAEGDTVDLIRDIHLLENLFHRILLKVTNASQSYIDRYTEEFPIRLLSESVDGPIRSKF